MIFIILVIFITVGAIFFVGYPLFKEGYSNNLLEDFEAGDYIHGLISKKDEAYVAIKDMDFDYMTGKLSKEDYQELRDRYKVKVLNIMKELDERKSVKKKNIEDNLEEEILNVRKDKAVKVKRENMCQSCGSQLLPDDKFCVFCGSRISLSLSCKKCGEKIGEKDKFCSFCGAKIS